MARHCVGQLRQQARPTTGIAQPFCVGSSSLSDSRVHVHIAALFRIQCSGIGLNAVLDQMMFAMKMIQFVGKQGLESLPVDLVVARDVLPESGADS